MKEVTAMGIKTITSSKEFTETIRHGIILVHFTASWCSPCRTQESAIEQLAHRFKKKVLIAEVDTDRNEKITAKLGIQNIPTLIIYKNSMEIERFVGLQSEFTLSGAIDKQVG